jgi:hypothetical protein
MLAYAIGDMLPVMTAIALTPLQIMGMVLVLGGPNARAGGPALLIGWLAALASVTVVAIFIVEKASEGGRASSPFVPWLQLALGLLLFWAALRLWKTRPKDDTEPKTPKWLASFGEAGPARALALGGARHGHAHLPAPHRPGRSARAVLRRGIAEPDPVQGRRGRADAACAAGGAAGVRGSTPTPVC